MIKLTKIEEPGILKIYKAQWCKELIDYVKRGVIIPVTVKNRYNQEEVKERLKKETNDKCMYCESYISAVSPEHIEHYKPKSLYPELTFEWSNLGLACPCCNIKKRDKFDEQCSYINPYIDNPSEHFAFLGTMICHNPNDKRAIITELDIELNRPELMEARKNQIDKIRSLIDLYTSETNPSLKATLKKNIEIEIGTDKPYSAFTNAYCKMMIGVDMI